MLTQAHSIAFTCVQYSLKAFMCTQACSMAHKGIHTCSSLFNCIHTGSKAFICTQLHVGISNKVHTVTFILTQWNPCALIAFNHIHVHSITFNCIQLHSILHKCVHMHSSMFRGDHTHSMVSSLDVGRGYNGPKTGDQGQGIEPWTHKKIVM